MFQHFYLRVEKSQETKNPLKPVRLTRASVLGAGPVSPESYQGRDEPAQDFSIKFLLIS